MKPSGEEGAAPARPSVGPRLRGTVERDVRHGRGEEGVIRAVEPGIVGPKEPGTPRKTAEETVHPDVARPEGTRQPRRLGARDQTVLTVAVTGDTGLVSAKSVQGLVAVAP